MKQGANGRRARGRSGGGGGGGRKQTPLKMQSFDSSGPDVRVRGHANQVYEKYMSLARDASSAGDRVIAESYFQHAEHYYRIMNETTDPETEPARRESAGEPNGDGDARGTRAERRERHERAERAQRGDDADQADGDGAGDTDTGDSAGGDASEGDGRSKRAQGRNRRGNGAKGHGRGRAHTGTSDAQPDVPKGESNTFQDDHSPGDADSDSAASA